VCRQFALFQCPIHAAWESTAETAPKTIQRRNAFQRIGERGGQGLCALIWQEARGQRGGEKKRSQSVFPQIDIIEDEETDNLDKFVNTDLIVNILVQCNTNIKFRTKYEYKYIHNLDFDRMRIVPMK
jgi:hypothetical protein